MRLWNYPPQSFRLFIYYFLTIIVYAKFYLKRLEVCFRFHGWIEIQESAVAAFRLQCGLCSLSQAPASSTPLTLLSPQPQILSLLSSSTDAALGRREIWSNRSESQITMIRENIKNSGCSPQIKDTFLPFGQLSWSHSCLPLLGRLRCPYPHLFLFLSLSLSLYLRFYKSKAKTTDFGWEDRDVCENAIFYYFLYPFSLIKA